MIQIFSNPITILLLFSHCFNLYKDFTFFTLGFLMNFFRYFIILFLFCHNSLIFSAYNKFIKTKKTTVVFKNLFMTVGLRLTIPFFNVYIYFFPFFHRHNMPVFLIYRKLRSLPRFLYI